MNRECLDTKIGKLIHAYELGALEPADMESFEAHLLECDFCFEQIEAFEEQAFLLQSGRLVRREIESRKESPSVSKWQRIWTSLWPDSPLPLRPAILLIVVLFLIYPAYRGFLVSGSHNITAVQSISLMPSRSSSTGVLSASDGRDGLISFVVPDAVPGQAYRLEITSADGRVSISDLSYNDFDTYRIGRLIIPAEEMKPGQYRLTISDPDGNTALPSGTFVFIIEE